MLRCNRRSNTSAVERKQKHLAPRPENRKSADVYANEKQNWEHYTYNLRAIKSNEGVDASVARSKILSHTFGTVDIKRLDVTEA